MNKELEGQDINLENPFKYLKRRVGDKKGQPFESDVVKNWYIARHFVLEKFRDEKYSIAPDDGCCVHLAVDINEERSLMLSVVRQIALTAHFSNYVEWDKSTYQDMDENGDFAYKCRNRTVITVVSENHDVDIVSEMSKEEYLGNLLAYCKYTLYGKQRNEKSYIDIEIDIVDEYGEDENSLWKAEDISDDIRDRYKAVDSENLIDTRMAVYANRMYSLGDLIDNLPAEDIHCAKRYVLALNAFQYVKMNEAFTPLVNREKWEKSQSTVKEGLSNLFCSDCFGLRYRGIKKSLNEELKKPKKEQSKEKLTKEKIWEYYNEKLSISEHARWIVEKLIMGYRPLNRDELHHYESLFGDDRKQYAKKLKSRADEPAHIDLCSYRDLRRIDPSNMKYDSFLVLAIPKIVEKVSESK